jgi:hypothetical protein
LSALSDTVTPAAWLRAHPEDTLQLYDRRLNSEGDERWCARAVRRMPGGDSSFVRYAYFYPPVPPADLALPATQNAQLIQQQCRLGAIWVQTRAINPPPGVVLAQQVRDSLQRVHGASLGGLGRDVVFLGSAGWSEVGRWNPGAVMAISAYDGKWDEPEPRVLAFAYLPFSGMSEPSGAIIEMAERDERQAVALAARAAQLSGLDSPKVNRLLRAGAVADSAYHGDDQRRGRYRAPEAARLLLSALRDWLEASKTLDPMHRAAALLAADQLLGVGAVRYVLAQDTLAPIVDSLKTIGAGFAEDHLGGGQAYTHTWLDQAQRLDSTGPAGRLATLALLHLGLDRSGMCGGTELASQRISALAEDLLRSTRDSSEALELHLLAGNGYGDIVALAAGAGDEYADTSAYVAAAPAARTHAIDHYRRALALSSGAALRQSLWLETWRMLAGLPPSRVYYFCVYD